MKGPGALKKKKVSKVYAFCRKMSSIGLMHRQQVRRNGAKFEYNANQYGRKETMVNGRLQRARVPPSRRPILLSRETLGYG